LAGSPSTQARVVVEVYQDGTWCECDDDIVSMGSEVSVTDGPLRMHHSEFQQMMPVSSPDHRRWVTLPSAPVAIPIRRSPGIQTAVAVNAWRTDE
jgi:hypothetical protein